jgi:hypothetical protein
MRLVRSSKSCAAFTLIDTTFAVALVGLFFIALFLVNSQCLYFVNCSRELLTAGGVLQTRMEQIRNLHQSQIAATDIQTILNAAVSGESALGSVQEVITVDTYPTASGSPIQVTRASNGTVTINHTNTFGSSGNSVLVSITAQTSWTSAPGARARSVSISTVWQNS